MDTKTCTRCKLTKPLAEFYALSSSEDGHDYICKQCRKELRDQRYAQKGKHDRAYARRRTAEERRELAWYRENYPVEGKPWNE